MELYFKESPVNMSTDAKGYTGVNRFNLICHQGNRIDSGAYGCTVPAFEQACKDGCDFINIAQVKYNADHDFYCIHDDTVDASTNGTGTISELTSGYMDSLIVNGMADTNYPHPPKLKDVLAVARKYGVRIFFRLGNLPGTYASDNDKDIWDRFFDLVHRYGYGEDCIYSQGTVGSLSVVNSLHPTYPLSKFISSSTVERCTEVIAIQVSDAVKNGWGNYHIHAYAPFITQESIDLAHDNGCKVIGIQRNVTLSDIQESLEKGCDAYQYDNVYPWKLT